MDNIHRAPLPADRTLAVRRLEEALQRGIGQAGTVVKRVLEQQPHDAIVKAAAMKFVSNGTDTPLIMAAGAECAWSFHVHAFGQVAQVAAAKGSEYLTVLRDGADWQRSLLATILNTTFGHSDKRHLIRSVGGDGGSVREARGFLSDKYRRIDSRPICEAFVEECQRAGGVPYGGSVMDTRHNLKFIVPEIQEVGGDFVAFGTEWASGDFGGVAHSLRDFFVRLACLNGAVVEDLLRQVHIGSRLDDGVAFSDRTMKLDTAATLSAMKDVVRSTMNPERRAAKIARIDAAAKDRVEGGGVRAFQMVARNLSKSELEKAVEAFDGPDVVNLPPESTRWRASNVLSFMAQHADQAPERREELERLAGSLLKAA